MFHHYLLPAVKRILRHRLYSAISILSLALGMVTCILIFGFIRYERSFDRMHHDGGSIYRLNWSVPETGSRFATFYNPMSPMLAEALPEIEQFTRLGSREHLVTVNGDNHNLDLTLVDNDFFRFFNYPALQGNPDTTIRDQRSVILTEAAALRLFGTTDVVGETLTVDESGDFRVGAVVANNPANSHLGSNVFLNIENLPVLWGIPDFWTRAGYIGSDVLYHYVRLAQGIDPLAFETTIENYIQRNLVPDYSQQVHLQPLANIHFNPDLQNELPMVDDLLGTVKPLRNITDILLFSTIAVLTMAIAALNFMNMQAVQFTRQIREVGIRRVTGSSYSMLTAQLLTEAALMSLLAFILAIPLCELLTPTVYSLLGIAAGEGEFLSLPVIVGLAACSVLLGILVVLYPAISAARISPVSALRGELLRGKRTAAFRSVLIVLQFTISIGLIVGSLTVGNQIDFALSKSLGFDPRNVVKIELQDAGANVYGVMKDALMSMSGVGAVSAGTSIPTRSLSDGSGFVPESGNVDEMLLTRSVAVSDDYFAVLGMGAVAGRVLSEDFASDKKPELAPASTTAAGGMMLNETAARLAGFSDPAQAVGKHFYQAFQVDGDTWLNDFTVVGVVADAHFGSIRRQVEPTAFLFPARYVPNVMMVRLTGEDPGTVLAAIDRLWQQQVPELPVRRSFLTDDYSALYAGEEKTLMLFIALSSLAVLIASSGLYALASYVTERRTREIGVRKVMGGTVWSIVLLLTGDFSKLVLLSNLIAWPLAWFAMSRWLENFAYRIDLTPLIFIGSGLIALCIAWVTVGGTAARAASAKPVLALRYE